MNNKKILLTEVVEAFDDLIGRIGEHSVVAGDEVYLQPYVYLSFHLIQMRVAGWKGMDFDQIAAVSGASALFGYEPGEFMPKYAHLSVNPDQRITEATGFGYTWKPFEGAEGAWELLKETIDAGRPVKGWDWENILFAGYQDADTQDNRQIFALADGPDTYAKWIPWQEFSQWVERVEGWHAAQLGCYTERVTTMSPKDIALRVIRDLIDWSTAQPDAILSQYPKATFGLEGIEIYAQACENIAAHEDWVACHDINGQWTIRNSTAVYLGRVAEAQVLPAQATPHLLSATTQYHAAYECWQAFYKLLGHQASETARNMLSRRQAGAAVVRAWLAHERAGVEALRKVKEIVG